MPEPAISIAPVRSDDDVAAASQLARDFFAYLRVKFPESAAAIDTYLVIQDFEGSWRRSASTSARRMASACRRGWMERRWGW